MQYVQTLKFLPTIQNSDYVCELTLDGSADPNYTITPVGSVDGDPHNVNPNWLTVDNIQNANGVTVAFGPFTALFVPAYSRKSFRLPVPSGNVVINFADASLAVYFVESQNYNIDDQNYLAIQEAARGVSLFPWIIYNAANSPQQTSDANSAVELLGVGFQITYTLLNIGAAGIKNGWFQFVYNNGNEPIIILPFGADTINGYFNNATPYILYPGEFGTLHSDGAQWFFILSGKRLPTLTLGAVVRTQKPSDMGRRLTFGGAAGSTYDLLAASTFRNGDGMRIKNNSTGQLSIVPNGADTIAGLFTNAAPLNIAPHDEIDLFIDDSGVWNVSGEITFTSGQVGFGPSVGGVLAHGLKVKPWFLQAWLICTGVELNYAIGDTLELGNGQSASAAVAPEHSFVLDATNITYMITARATLQLPSKVDATAVNIAMTGPIATNWKLFFIAKVRL